MERVKLQFIKNFFAPYNHIQFRKYNVIENCMWSDLHRKWLYWTKKQIYIIPSEYVKIYKY